MNTSRTTPRAEVLPEAAQVLFAMHAIREAGYRAASLMHAGDPDVRRVRGLAKFEEQAERLTQELYRLVLTASIGLDESSATAAINAYEAEAARELAEERGEQAEPKAGEQAIEYDVCRVVSEHDHNVEWTTTDPEQAIAEARRLSESDDSAPYYVSTPIPGHPTAIDVIWSSEHEEIARGGAGDGR